MRVSTAPDERLTSLDAFRGLTIGAMMVVNNPGDWNALYPPLAHASWDGYTPTDLVFPFFLFIGGVAMTLSLARRSRDASSMALTLHLMRRGFVILAIGIALNAVPTFQWDSLRLPGVLQRIGLCVILAAPLVVHACTLPGEVWRRWRPLALAAALLMAVYAFVQLAVPVPGADGVVRTGSLQPGQDVASWLDRRLLDGHLWRQSRTWDPEGLLTTLPAVATLLTGALAGLALAGPWPLRHRIAGLALAGVLCLPVAGLLHTVLMPINKNLWTPSYVLLSTGWALLLFAAFLALLDGGPVQRQRRWRWLCHPLVVLGMNALFLFVLSSLIGRLIGFVRIPQGAGESLPFKVWAMAGLKTLPVSPELGSLLYALGFLVVMFGIAWVLWRRRWFISV
jgi:predicted acyltransferase